jgi:putative transposase
MPRSYRVVSTENYAYFVTCSTIEHLPLFTEPAYAKIILDSLAFIREFKNVRLNSFVLMSTHLHAVLWPKGDANLSDILRDFKRHTSRSISKLAQNRKDIFFLQHFSAARDKSCPRENNKLKVWQDGSHPEVIYSDDFARQKIEYIHFNFVKAGLIAKPEDWPNSSARAYLMNEATYPPTDLMPLW